MKNNETKNWLIIFGNLLIRIKEAYKQTNKRKHTTKINFSIENDYQRI
jgi:hypothetical protein